MLGDRERERRGMEAKTKFDRKDDVWKDWRGVGNWWGERGEKGERRGRKPCQATAEAIAIGTHPDSWLSIGASPPVPPPENFEIVEEKRKNKDVRRVLSLYARLSDLVHVSAAMAIQQQQCRRRRRRGSVTGSSCMCPVRPSVHKLRPRASKLCTTVHARRR